MSPTSRSLAHLRHLGYQAAIVEKWNPYARRRVDCFGRDLLVLKAGEPVLAALLVIAVVTRRLRPWS